MADIDEEALCLGTTARDPLGSRPRDRWEKGMLMTKVVMLSMFSLPSLMVLMLVSNYASNVRDVTEVSMRLDGYEGLNATLGHTVSPVFNLKVHVENPRVVLQPWCYNGGEVTVSYSNVVLAWGQVPHFCMMKRKAPIELTVVPLGREVGLSEDLRGRLASDWHMGTAQIMVDMKLFYEDQSMFASRKNHVPSLHSFQLMLRGAEQ